MITFKYGAMSSLFSLEAENKYTAYVTMVTHYDRQAHMIALYKPVENKDDSWLNITGEISKRLDEIFKEVGGFDKYTEDHLPEIKECYKSINRLL